MTDLRLSLPQLFIRKNLLNQSQLAEIHAYAKENNTSFIISLVASNYLSPKLIAQCCHNEYGIDYIDLATLKLTELPKKYLDKTLIEKHHCLPLFHKEKRLIIATSDPTKIDALEAFQFHTRLHAEFILVEEDKLADLLKKVLREDFNNFNLHTPNTNEIDINDIADISETEQPSKDDAPIITYINKILIEAIERGASDLHFEPYEKRYRIRFRVDGILYDIAQPPITFSNRIAARLKVMSKLNIAERRVPQDGRFQIRRSKTKNVDFRISTLPTLWGEKIVIRILDNSAAKLGIDNLGYEEDQKQLYLSMLTKTQGMILVTGPTGSGKTVSLYTGLHILNTDERNISTAEDPIEIHLDGINQVHINPKVGLSFASALRSFLRQDPDVVMVGEIRDLETAEIAIKAAQTGHLVLSTLHTNSSAETLSRLINMGVPAYNIASSVNLIIAQRLARRLCNKCRQIEHIPPTELIRLGFTQTQIDAGFNMYKPLGCEHCIAGYKGRVGIYEVMKMSEELANAIMAGSNSLQIAQIAKTQGMQDLRQSGLLKVIQGVTSISEINRVTGFHST